MATFDLKIEKHGTIYELSWSQGDEVLFVGVGIETPDGLSAGWDMVNVPKQDSSSTRW